MKRARDAAFAVLLVMLIVTLYRKVLRLWWTYDDVNLIHLAIDHSLGDAFFLGAVWPQKLFTPMLLAGFEANLALFGLDPARWFIVHFVVLAMSLLAFYAALRLWFEPWSSATAVLLYAASVPMCSLITRISCIHYFIAILCGSLSTIAYVHALRKSRSWLSIASASILLTGMLAKETVIPLPFLLLALPERDLRARAGYATPHAIALAIYFLWRRAVIGTMLGGYGWAVERNEWPALLAALPEKIVLASAGANAALGLALILLMTIGVVAALRCKRGAILFLVALALAVGPILPVSQEMQRRYALMPWLSWSVAFVAGAEALRRRAQSSAHGRRAVAIGVTSLLVGVPLLMVVVNRQEWGLEFGRTQRMSDEARFFFDMPPRSLLRAPTVPPAAMGEVNWLKTVHLHKPSGAAVFYDDYYLCTIDLAGMRAWEYAPRRREIVEISSALPRMAQQYCRSIRWNAPLRAELEYRDDSLFWMFGPYLNGRYRVLLANGQQAFDVPRQAGFRLPDVPGLALRIRYESPEGWTTYSPEISLDFVNRPKMTWRR